MALRSLISSDWRHAVRMKSCRLCRRECAPSSDFCAYHLVAKGNIESGYRQWAEGYGAITWKEYLLKLRDNPETGEWAKGMAELLSNESTG
jgi:hypothetical protein